LALIRLQWWREVVEGAARSHEVATPLGALLAQGAVPRALLLRMIDMREAEAGGPPETLDEFVAMMRQGPGALALAAGAALGDAAPRLEQLGAAYGIAGALRNVPAMARHGRCDIPVDVLAQAGLVPEAVIAQSGAVLAAARPALVAAGETLLGATLPMSRTALAAALPAALARRDFKRVSPPIERGAVDRMAVLWAAISNKI
jgi:phytoene synthase